MPDSISTCHGSGGFLSLICSFSPLSPTLVRVSTLKPAAPLGGNAVFNQKKCCHRVQNVEHTLSSCFIHPESLTGEWLQLKSWVLIELSLWVYCSVLERSEGAHCLTCVCEGICEEFYTKCLINVWTCVWEQVRVCCSGKWVGFLSSWLNGVEVNFNS